MSTLALEALATEVWCDEDNLWVRLSDGRQLAVPLAYYPRLLHATAAQRARYQISGGGRAIHWDEIDEDLSVEGLILGIPDQTKLGRGLRATG
jgi:hypothetical protein